jgi:hypothetical protein
MMADSAEPRFDIVSYPGPLGAGDLDRLKVVIPDDELRAKRERNLAIARQVIVALDPLGPAGLVFVRTIAGVPNVTWLVAERARRRGLAVRMLKRLQQDWWMLTAICRNEASLGVARGAGFAIAGPFAAWFGAWRA